MLAFTKARSHTSWLLRAFLFLAIGLEMSHMAVAFRFTSRPTTSNAICLRMCKPAQTAGVIQRRLKSAITAVIIAASTADTSFALPDAPVPITRSVLEQSIQTLEASTTRSEVIQSLADVFEAAGTKTLLVRTKYKYRIVNAINDKHRKLNNEWDQALGYASGELKRRADPLRTVDLGGYLKIAPFVGGAGYLGSLFIQQALPELFVFAYPIAVFVFAAPIVFIIIAT